MGKLRHLLHSWTTTIKSRCLFLHVSVSRMIHSGMLPHYFLCFHLCRYGIVIQHPGQPLLLLKQSHNAHNLLFSKLKYLGTVIPNVVAFLLCCNELWVSIIVLLLTPFLHDIPPNLWQMVQLAILCSWRKSKFMPESHLNYSSTLMSQLIFLNHFIYSLL